MARIAEVIQADGEKNHKTTQPFAASADPSLHKQNMEGAYVPGPDAGVRAMLVKNARRILVQRRGRTSRVVVPV